MEKKRIYCAIYTRKSTTEGLDQDFTSLDAQREAAQNYIASQKSEGWVPLQEQYNDGGFTGANLERPGLQKLLSDIKQHKIDCVVVYKVDRLSRSLIDFARLLEFFDQNNVAFVSITQQFNTNTSMGRLTLNILLSFAQFEREIISERTKDKMGAARKRGQWLGGRPPLGYDVDKEHKRLIVNTEEAKLIKEIFNLYVNGNSLLKVAQIINDKGYRTKYVIAKTGKSFGNGTFGITHIQWLIKSVLYIGKVCYYGQIYNGQHDAIVDEETFKKAQAMLAHNRRERRVRKNTEFTGLLSHLLHCKACNTFMFHTYVRKKGIHKYRYYVCSNAQKRGYRSCPTRSVNAQAIEDAVISCLRKMLSNKPVENQHNVKETEALLSPIWDTLHPEEKRRILKVLVQAVDYNHESKKLGIILGEDAARVEFDVDLRPVRGLRKRNHIQEITKEPKIRSTIILAHQIQRLQEQGRIKSLKEAAKWLNLSHVRIDQVMNMLLISPRIQEEILCTESPAFGQIPEYKLRSVINEPDWQKQEDVWQRLIQA